MSRRLALTALTLVFMLVMNTLANALPINGRTSGAVSDSFPLVFVPAGYVFSIWGLIYVGLISLVVYAFTGAGRRSSRVAALGGAWLPLNFTANGLWILCWHYGFYLGSLILMLVILASLKAVHARLDACDGAGRATAGETWLVRVPLSIYQGWISVATIPNFAVVLLVAGWNGAPLAPETWGAIFVVVAAALNLFMVLRSRDVPFGAVGVWALAGIGVKQATAFPLVATLSNAGAVVIALAILITLASRGSSARAAGGDPRPAAA